MASVRFLALVPALLLGCAEPEPEPRYLALGDSYTVGQGVPTEQSFPRQLLASLREGGIDLGDVHVVGRSGYTTSDLQAAIERDLAGDPVRYELVTLLIGVNNHVRGGDVERYAADFAALLDEAIRLADGRPERVIVLSLPDYTAAPRGRGFARGDATAIDDFNAVIREQAAAAGANYVDITDISRRGRDDHTLHSADLLHPSAQQYARWVERLVAVSGQVLGAEAAP